MRLALLAAIPAVALTLLGGASAAKPVRVPSHCSKSGDVCYWIVEAGTSHNLRLTLAAKVLLPLSNLRQAPTPSGHVQELPREEGRRPVGRHCELAAELPV